MAYWVFFDFIDGNGRNGVNQWIESLKRRAKIVKAELNNRLLYLETCERLRRPHTGDLRGYAGVYEIVMPLEGVQYRPLFCYGPERSEVTILTGTVEKGGRMPVPDCERALQRMILVSSDRPDRRYVCEHDFS